MSRVRCLYCDVDNDAVLSAGYCESCGKKLPSASQARKRREPVVPDRGGVLPVEGERTPPQQASAWLFTAAIVNLVGCGGLIVLGSLLVPREKLKAEFIPDLLLVSVVTLLIFAALGWWARSQPVAAVLTAAIVYLGLAIVDALMLPALALLGLPVKIVIFALLIQALRISRKPRRYAAHLSVPDFLVSHLWRNLMPITIHIPTPMRQHAEGQASVAVAGTNVQTALAALGSKYPALTQRLFENGQVRRFVNIYLNNEDIRYLDNLATSVKDGDEIAIIPAVAGG